MAKDTSELVIAAQTIENDQRRLEDLAYALDKTKLQSEKTIARAGRELQEALQQQEQLAVSLRGLGQAMANMQERQQAAVAALRKRAEQIQARRGQLAEFMTRYAALGAKAAELLQTISSTLEAADQKAAIAIAHERLTPVIEEATSLAKSAREEDFTEVAHEADVLKQKFHAIKNQLAAGKSLN